MMILIKVFGFYVNLLCTISFSISIIHKCVKEVPKHIDEEITQTPTILIFIPKNNVHLKEIDDVIKDISNRSTKNSLIIVNSADSLGNMNEDIKITHYFIYFESLGKLSEIFKKIKNLLMQHQPHLFLIALNKFQNIDEIFYFAVNNFHTSIIKLMLLIETSSNTCNLYRTAFFKHFSCHPKRQDNYQLIDLCVEGKFKSNTSWYNHETPYKFQSCQLNVVYLNIPPYVLNIKNNSVLMLNTKKTKEYNNLHGTEVGMLSNIFRTMNVSLRFINGNELGEVFSNSTVTGSLKFLVDNRADIAIGGYSKNPSRFKYFDCSLAYHQEYLSWAVPHQEFSVKYIARIIHFNILIGIAVIVCSISAIVVIVARYNRFEREYFKNPTNVLFQLAIVSIINFPVSILPKTAGIRLIYIHLLIFSLIFNVAFVTFLASVLTQHKLWQKYANSSDILENKLHVYMVPNSDRFFENATDLVNLNFMRLAEICPVAKFMDCINDVAVNKNAAFLAQKGLLDYAQMSMVISKNNENNIHLLPPIVAYPINFIMKKGFWATQRVNQLILISFETGLIKKWMEIPFFYNIPKRNLREQNEKKSEDTISLWIILFTGYLISAVVLVIEILIYKRKLTQK